MFAQHFFLLFFPTICIDSTFSLVLCLCQLLFFYAIQMFILVSILRNHFAFKEKGSKKQTKNESKNTLNLIEKCYRKCLNNKQTQCLKCVSLVAFELTQLRYGLWFHDFLLSSSAHDALHRIDKMIRLIAISAEKNVYHIHRVYHLKVDWSYRSNLVSNPNKI